MRAVPGLDELPTEFPVFPLGGALLLPHGRLPLNIFEPRYLALVDDALGAGRLFGMIQPELTAPAGADGPALFRVGCIGRLCEFSETDDGRYVIALTGIIRFLVVAELPGRRGYRRIKADFAPFAGDLETRAPASLQRKVLLDELRGFFARLRVSANWEAIERIPDTMLIATLSMVCPFDAPEKQALLEAMTPDDQLDVLLALLRMGGIAGEGSSGRSPS